MEGTGVYALEVKPRDRSAMRRNMKRHRNQKVTTNTAYPAPVQLSVVPIVETQNEIENTIDAPRRLTEAIEELKVKRADAEGDLTQSLSRDPATGPLNAETAIERHKAWKAKDELLAAKIKTAEELGPIIEERIAELKATQVEALKVVIRRKLDRLQSEAEGEKRKRRC